MGSSSSSSSATLSRAEDNRVAGDNGAIGVSSDGDVNLHMVSDEAWQLGQEAIAQISDLAREVTGAGSQATEAAQGALALALDQTQQRNRSEETQLSEQIIKIGIPAAALAFAVSQIWGK